MSVRSWKEAAITYIKIMFEKHQEKERPNLIGQPRVRKYFKHLLKHQEDI
jgi:hemerythrin superfamily protein